MIVKSGSAGLIVVSSSVSAGAFGRASEVLSPGSSSAARVGGGAAIPSSATTAIAREVLAGLPAISESNRHAHAGDSRAQVLSQRVEGRRTDVVVPDDRRVGIEQVEDVEDQSEVD